MSANLSGLQNLFAARLSAAVAAAEKATGAKANFVSGRRTAAQGVEIWNRATGGGRHAPSFPAARPGHSRHERGEATDMGPGPVRDWIQKHAKEYGLEPANAKRGFKWDPPHIQLDRGAVKTAYDTTPSMWAGDGQRLPPKDIPNVAPTAGHQKALGMGLGRIHSGPQVRELQTKLATAGFNPGKVDGVFGPKTAAAVRAAETKYGLGVDKGVAGPAVQSALELASHPAYAPGGGAAPVGLPSRPPPAPGGAPITPTPRGDLAARPYDSGSLYPGITQKDLITGPPDPFTMAALNAPQYDLNGSVTAGGGVPGAAATMALTDAPDVSPADLSPFNVGAGYMPQMFGPGGMKFISADNPAFGAAGASGMQGYSAPPPGGGPWGTSSHFSDPNDANGVTTWVDPELAPGLSQPKDAFDALGQGVAGINNDVMNAAGNAWNSISDGVQNWLGGGASAAAKPPIQPASPGYGGYIPGGFSWQRQYALPPQQQGSIGDGFLQHASGYGASPSGDLSGLPHYASLSDYLQAPTAGPPLPASVVGGPSSAGAEETPLFHGQPIGGAASPGVNTGPIGGPGVTPAGGEPFSQSMYPAPFANQGMAPDLGPAMSMDYATPQSVYTPPPSLDVSINAQQAVPQIASNGASGGPSLAPWSPTQTHYGGSSGGGWGGGYSAPQAQTASWIGNYFGSSGVTPGPYTGATAPGYTAPNFNPISGGSTYAWNPSNRTYINSYGQTMSMDN